MCKTRVGARLQHGTWRNAFFRLLRTSFESHAQPVIVVGKRNTVSHCLQSKLHFAAPVHGRQERLRQLHTNERWNRYHGPRQSPNALELRGRSPVRRLNDGIVVERGRLNTQSGCVHAQAEVQHDLRSQIRLTCTSAPSDIDGCRHYQRR